MSIASFAKSRLTDIPRDLILLAFINGLSDMALSAGSIFGVLAILSGSYFIHGVTGLAVYVAGYGSATFIGYVGVCRYGATMGLRIRTALYAVFLIHAAGFAAAAFIHPACVAISNGLGLGMFYAVLQLKNINEIADHARDRYATFMGLIQQSTGLVAPFLGTLMLYAGVALGIHDPFLPPFLAFAFCALIALPVIRRIPNAPLPYSVILPVRAVMETQHAPAIGLVFSTTFCEFLINPLLIISSFALLGKVVKVSGFATVTAVVAVISLALSHRMRLPGKRWVILGASLIGIGLAYAMFDFTFKFETLLLTGVIFALLHVNFGAAWFALGTRLLEREWGHFGKNQALVLGEIFILAARLTAAAVFLACGILDLTLRQDIGVIVTFFLLSALIASGLARFLDRKYQLPS
jgi:hypothetical protein